MNKYMMGTIKSCGIRIGYEIPDRISSCLDPRLLGKYIPDMGFDGEKLDNDYHIQIREDDERSFIYGDRECIINTDIMSNEDFFAITSRTLESLLFRRRLFSMHSA